MEINANSSQSDLISIINNTYDTKKLLEAINHPNADDNVLNAAIQLSATLSKQNKATICESIMNSKVLTSEVLCKLIDIVPTTEMITNVIANPKADEIVLDKVVKEVATWDYVAQRNIYSVVIDSSIVTPEILCKVIENAKTTSIVIKAVSSPKANEVVLLNAVEEGATLDYGPQKTIYSEVIDSKVITPLVLCSIVENAKTSDVIIKAASSPIADERVLDKVVKVGATWDYGLQKSMYSAVIDSNVATSETLCDLVKNAKTTSIVIKAVSSPKANEAVLINAVEEGATLDYGPQKTIYSEVIDSKVITPLVLCSIVEHAQTSDVVMKAIESPRADKIVLDKAEIRADSFSPHSRKQILETIDKQRKNINKVAPLQLPKLNDVEFQSAKTKNFTIEVEDNVTERIRRNVEDGMSTMLWGLSGIGKTARVREIDPTFTMIKLKNDMLPEEVTGGKEPNGEPGQIYPPKWYVKLCEKCEAEPDRMHILFIDEITNVKNNVKSLVWEIIGERRVNGDEDWQLPDNCAIVAAGNRPEESTSVITDYNGGVLPEPLHDRFDFHIEIPLDILEWQQWALETDTKTGNLNIHPVVLSFCVARADKVMFSSIDVNDITKPRLSPRRWEKLSKAIYMAEKRGGKSCHVSNQRIAECIGSDLAPAFITHYQKEPLDMKKVEDGLYEPTDFDNIDDKLFALSLLIAEYNGSDLAVIDFIQTCLGDDYGAVYNVMKKQRAAMVPISKNENQGTIKR